MTEQNSGFFVVHLNGGNESSYRTETILVVNNTIVTLTHILTSSGISLEDIYAYDQGISSGEVIQDTISHDIEKFLQKNQGIAYVLCSVLTYNAKETIDFVNTLKTKFSEDICIVLGGQLVTQLDVLSQEQGLTHPYLQYADTVAVGDGEAILPMIVQDISGGTLKNLYRGFLGETGKDGIVSGGFATVNNYDMSRLQDIEQRLANMQNISGIRMLSIQGKGGPGCRWAIKSPDGACSFCALSSITTANSTSLGDLVRQSFDLKKSYDLTMVFDVANQFIPHGSKERKAYLREYLAIVEQLEEEYKIERPHIFAYVTLSSLLDEETVSLLHQIGVRQVYVGLEHLADDMTAKQGKPVQRNTLKHTAGGLKNAMKYGINVNGGFVLGSPGETLESLEYLYNNLELLLQEQQDHRDTGGKGGLMQLGFYPVELIPGSRDYKNFVDDAYTGKLGRECDITKNLFEKYIMLGYLTREEQQFLTTSFIQNYAQVSAEEVFTIRDRLIELSKSYGLMGYSVDVGDNKDKLSNHWLG